MSVIGRTRRLSCRSGLAKLHGHGCLRSHKSDLMGRSLPIDIVVISYGCLGQAGSVCNRRVKSRLLQQATSILQQITNTSCLPVHINNSRFLLIYPRASGRSTLKLRRSLHLNLTTMDSRALAIDTSVNITAIRATKGALTSMCHITSRGVCQRGHVIRMRNTSYWSYPR